jgi:hypothetical protein
VRVERHDTHAPAGHLHIVPLDQLVRRQDTLAAPHNVPAIALDALRHLGQLMRTPQRRSCTTRRVMAAKVLDGRRSKGLGCRASSLLGVNGSGMSRTLSALLFTLAVAAVSACSPAVDSHVVVRPPLAAQWLDRAKTSYRSGDFDDARESVRHAMAAAPNDAEIRTLDARVALAHLDWAEALRLTDGIATTEAHGIRGRAYWFSGDLERAADELEILLQDPHVKDPWAREVATLARQGVGRHPFEIEGGIVAPVEMPRAIAQVSLGTANVVPCELDGDRILALVATGSSEVILDSNARRDPSWVSIRFGDRIEVKDVPALTQDLTQISHTLGVPIKALLGANLLRHAHATFDRRGDQFVVRRNAPLPPPDASRIPLYYIRGGGMMMRANVTARDDGEIPLLVDSSRMTPLLLQDAAWKKAGVDVKTLVPLPDSPNVRRGLVPTFRLGGFDLAKMPAMEGIDLGDIASTVDVDLGGVVGSDLLAFFRVTFADEGRFIWIEPDPMLVATAGPPPRPGSPPPPSTKPPASSAPPAASGSATAAPVPAPPPPAPPAASGTPAKKP